MTLHGFICASPLYPDEPARDEALHTAYMHEQRRQTPPAWVKLSVIQNGCRFPGGGLTAFSNPFPKNLSYNWLVCDANCEAEYWLFLPEDCVISSEGWSAIRQHIDRGKECFALSKDPKAIVCRKGIFQPLSQELQIVCDMNALGKEIGCVLLRGELDRKGFHTISKNWRRVSDEPKRWGNELYQEINVQDHPFDVNRTRALPTFHDYGVDGWKAPQDILQATFMKIIEKNLDRQRQAAEQMKAVVSHYGPLITEVPYRGLLADLGSRVANFVGGNKPRETS